MAWKYLTKDFGPLLVFSLCLTLVVMVTPLVLELLLRGGYNSKSGWVCRRSQPVQYLFFQSLGCLTLSGSVSYLVYWFLAE